MVSERPGLGQHALQQRLGDNTTDRRGLSTVKAHLARLMNELAARNRVEIAMWASETGRPQASPEWASGPASQQLAAVGRGGTFGRCVGRKTNSDLADQPMCPRSRLVIVGTVQRSPLHTDDSAPDPSVTAPLAIGSTPDNPHEWTNNS